MKPFFSRRALARIPFALALLAAPPLAGPLLAAPSASPAPLPRATSPRPVAVDFAEPAVSVPIAAQSATPVVEVMVNGRGPFRFLLDTGASTTVLDLGFARELGLPVVGTTRIGDPADPEGILADVVAIERLAIGGATFRNFTAAAWERAALRPGPDAPRGVLGVPLFAEVLLTLDYPAGRLVLSRGELPPVDGKEVLAFHPGEGGGLPAIDLEVAGRTVEATLDTGASGALSFPARYQAELPLAGPVAVIGRGRMAGGETEIRGATLAGDVRLGAHRLERPLVTFSDRLTHVNLGSGLLGRYAVTLDSRNRRVRFVAPPPSATAPVLDAAALGDYIGVYGGIRRVSADGSRLVLQRLSGPQGAGPLVPLAAVEPDGFALDGERTVRFRFERDAAGRVTALSVLLPDGRWERGEKGG
jgi:hypothetical protein